MQGPGGEGRQRLGWILGLLRGSVLSCSGVLRGNAPVCCRTLSQSGALSRPGRRCCPEQEHEPSRTRRAAGIGKQKLGEGKQSERAYLDAGAS